MDCSLEEIAAPRTLLVGGRARGPLLRTRLGAAGRLSSKRALPRERTRVGGSCRTGFRFPVFLTRPEVKEQLAPAQAYSSAIAPWLRPKALMLGQPDDVAWGEVAGPPRRARSSSMHGESFEAVGEDSRVLAEKVFSTWYRRAAKAADAMREGST